MSTNKKYVTTISISPNIREKLRQQADKIGMDMSSYIAYLVMYKEEKEKQEKRNQSITKEFLQAFQNQNIFKEGDE